MQDFIRLSGSRSELVFSTLNGVPELIHWGPKIPDLQGVDRARSTPVPQGGLDVVPPLSLTMDAGTGLFCTPGLQGHRNGLDWSPVFELENAIAIENSVQFIYQDKIAKLALLIDVSLDDSTDMISWHSTLKNVSDDAYTLNRLAITFPIPHHMTQLKSFGGRWCQEFMEHDSVLKHGSIQLNSRHGRTSHQKSPFWLMGRPGFSNTQGEVIGMHFAWSGDHSFNFEVTSDGRLMAQVNELLHPGEVCLKKGESYQTPRLFLSRSEQGSNGISQAFHQFIRNAIVNWPGDKPRPVILNTWEGIYFDHDPGYIIKMVEASANIGVERFVLDDGWFRGRNGERAALGDWQLDTVKYPNGLEPVIDAVKANGMEFGIWVEPEMINPDSDLYRAHPDWAMRIEGYDAPLGRYQHVLNLQIDAAFKHIFDCLDKLLSDYDIAYVKWDMNRQFVQAAHEGKPGTSGQTRAFYRLISALREKHPQVEIESCASGGGRVDIGVLRHTHRFWTSDCNDALERVMIQSGFSTFFPPEVMGAHIGSDEAHTTHRRHNSQFRAIVALFGHLGLELDPVKASEQETTEFAEYVALHKRLRPILHDKTGRFLQLDHSSDENIKTWMAMNGDGSKAVVAFLQTAMPRFSVPGAVPLHYLDNEAVYRIEVLLEEDNIGYAMKQKPQWMTQSLTISGAWLNQHGLQLPVLYPETGLLIELAKV